MDYYSTAIALFFHSYFWGLGLALFVLPRIWRRYWWAFAPCCGLALQSAVVWAGAHSPMAGTDRYAWASEVLPLGLDLLAAILRWRPLLRGLIASTGAAVVVVVCSWALLMPMAQGARKLTTASIGSCDAADYAAGARVFQEFSKDDRTGFLGQTEVTSVGTSKTFFDFWLRLNHFTPSALLAHNASILGLPPWQLAGVTGAVLAALNIPAMLLLCRKTIGLRGGPLLLVVALYGFSPLVTWAVDQVALAQIYASLGITTLTLVCFASTQADRFGLRVATYTLLTAAGIWLLAGSYNFILLVAFAPGGAWLMAHAMLRRNPRPAGRALQMIAVALALCLPLFWGRFEGIAERFQLFDEYGFGWPIPILTPEGWLGLVRSAELAGWPAYPRIAACIAIVVLWGVGVYKLWRQRKRRQSMAAVALVLPVVVGWSILAQGVESRPTASYDAFKLISVFLPCLICGLVCWLAAAQHRRRWQLDATIVLVALLAGNLWGTRQFQRRMIEAPLHVDQALSDLATLERDSNFESFNIVIRKYWDRLWANHFLLRKQQYFKEHTYEGRRPTALSARWSLSDEVKDLSGYESQYFKTLSRRFQLVRVDLPKRFDLEFEKGWYAVEKDASAQWRWSSGNGELVITNAAKAASKAGLRIGLQGLGNRSVYLLVNGTVVAMAPVSSVVAEVDFGMLELRPGDTRIGIASSEPAVTPQSGDSRKLAFSIHTVTLDDLQLFGVKPVSEDGLGMRSVTADRNFKLEWSYGQGWYGQEQANGRAWRWSSGASTIRVQNGLNRPVLVSLVLTLSSMGSRRLQLMSGDELLDNQTLAANRREYEFGEIVLQPGGNEFALSSPDAYSTIAGDSRKLSFALWGVAIRPQSGAQLLSGPAGSAAKKN